MNYKIRYLPMADEDIEVLADYLSRFYHSTADQVLGEMEQRLNRLQDHPLMCEVYADDSFYRRMVVSDYLVFYHVNEQNRTVDIHRVLRGSWDIKNHLPKSED